MYKSAREIRKIRNNCAHIIDIRINRSGTRTEYFCNICGLCFSAHGASYYMELSGYANEWPKLAARKRELEEKRKSKK